MIDFTNVSLKNFQDFVGVRKALEFEPIKDFQKRFNKKSRLAPKYHIAVYKQLYHFKNKLDLINDDDIEGVFRVVNGDKTYYIVLYLRTPHNSILRQ